LKKKFAYVYHASNVCNNKCIIRFIRDLRGLIKIDFKNNRSKFITIIFINPQIKEEIFGMFNLYR